MKTSGFGARRILDQLATSSTELLWVRLSRQLSTRLLTWQVLRHRQAASGPDWLGPEMRRNAKMAYSQASRPKAPRRGQRYRCELGMVPAHQLPPFIWPPWGALLRGTPRAGAARWPPAGQCRADTAVL